MTHLVLAAALLSMSASEPAAQDGLGGQWKLRPATGAETREGAALYHVALFTPGLTTFHAAADLFEGLPPHIAAADDAAVRFELRRDAGRFRFEGFFEKGRGTGSFIFEPDPAFANGLVRRGLARPTPAQQFSMARHDVGLALLDELAAQGYARPSTDALVDAETIKRPNAEAARPLSLDDLMRLRLRSDAAATARQDVVESDTPLRGRWTLDRVSGNHADLEVFWVDDTNWRRTVALSRFTGLTTRDLNSAVPVPATFRMEHEAGVFEFEGHIQRGRGTGDFRFTPKREFIQALRSIGLSGIDRVSDHQLKNLVWGGVTSADVRDFHAHGFSRIDHVLDFAIFGVTAEYVKALSGLGYKSLSASQVVDLWRAGVSPVFVKRMHDAGHAGASPERLIELHRRTQSPCP